MPSQLENEFHNAMIAIYRDAKREINYNATRFFQMVSEHGGHMAARRLIASPEVSEGYTALWMQQRLDLTMEAMILRESKYHDLFSADELEICRKRLAAYKYDSGNN